MGAPARRQGLEVLIVDDECHAPGPGGHRVGHVVAHPQHPGGLDHDVVGLQRGVGEVPALPLLGPRRLLAAVRHQTGVEDQGVLVLGEHLQRLAVPGEVEAGQEAAEGGGPPALHLQVQLQLPVGALLHPGQVRRGEQLVLEQLGAQALIVSVLKRPGFTSASLDHINSPLQGN